MKNRKIYVCENCGYETGKWIGRCPSCAEWNKLTEVLVEKNENKAITEMVILADIDDIKADSSDRIDTGIDEMNRVLGGGIVRGSIVLIGGDPGIGKSTILLQLCKTSASENDILYFSGEESLGQIGLRAKRIGAVNKKIKFASETKLENICSCIEDVKPDIAVVDSIQTVYSQDMLSLPGSVSQIRNAALALIRTAKKTNTSIFLVGHVTKEGSLAGPRILEHMVDTVLYFEGDRSNTFRILRAVKNRFGSTNEIGVFEMSESGLSQVSNPSAVMLSGRSTGAVGSCIIPIIEGTRPMLAEIQALVCATSFGMPRRMSTGVDNNRLTMLMAVLEKILGLKLYNCDAYVNAAGGFKITEPACDLAILSSISSSFKNKPIDDTLVIMGEAGLTGEIRAVSQIDKRIKETVKMGFKTAVVPQANVKEAIKASENITIKGADTIKTAFDFIFGP